MPVGGNLSTNLEANVETNDKKALKPKEITYLVGISEKLAAVDADHNNVLSKTEIDNVYNLDNDVRIKLERINNIALFQMKKFISLNSHGQKMNTLFFSSVGINNLEDLIANGNPAQKDQFATYMAKGLVAQEYETEYAHGKGVPKFTTKSAWYKYYGELQIAKIRKDIYKGLFTSGQNKPPLENTISMTTGDGSITASIDGETYQETEKESDSGIESPKRFGNNPNDYKLLAPKKYAAERKQFLNRKEGQDKMNISLLPTGLDRDGNSVILKVGDRSIKGMINKNTGKITWNKSFSIKGVTFNGNDIIINDNNHPNVSVTSKSAQKPNEPGQFDEVNLNITTNADIAKPFDHIIGGFPSGKVSLSKEMKDKIRQEKNKIDTYLKYHPDAILYIDGYSSTGGDKNLNKKLSQQRADALKNQLISEGVPEKNIIAKGRGETDNFTVGNDKSANRRIDFSFGLPPE